MTAVKNDFAIRLGNNADLKSIIELHRKYLYDNIDSSELNKGFVRVMYSENEMSEIIRNEEIVITCVDNKIIAYYLLGYRSNAKSLAYQYEALTTLYLGNSLLNNLKIAFGAQAIVDEKYRSLRLTGKMLQVLIENVKFKYDYLFSSITKINDNAQKVHERSGYIVIGEDSNKVFVLLKIN